MRWAADSSPKELSDEGNPAPVNPIRPQHRFRADYAGRVAQMWGFMGVTSAKLAAKMRVPPARLMVTTLSSADCRIVSHTPPMRLMRLVDSTTRAEISLDAQPRTYFTSGSVALNSSVPACWSSSKISISVDVITAPACRILSRPIRQLSSVREPTASLTT